MTASVCWTSTACERAATRPISCERGRRRSRNECGRSNPLVVSAIPAQQLVAAGESVVDVPAGVVDTHTSVGIRSGTEERPEQCPIGRDRRASNRGLTHVNLDDHAQVLKLLAKRHRVLARRAETASRLLVLLTDSNPAAWRRE